jgi:DNA adenine methylase
MSFPETKFMGSKRALLPFILERARGLRFRTVLDAFSGSACVSYAFKKMGRTVHANDLLHFSFHTARAAIENNGTQLDECDLRRLLRPNRRSQSFIQVTFRDLYFPQDDNLFLDNLRANIEELESPLKKSLALAAACRAAMKKRPRGIFTFTGKKGWDGRRDLRLSMKEQFLLAVESFNRAVFSNGHRNKAFRSDVFEIESDGYDLVYIDSPYISRYSDCDYTRRYHFLEGLCTYWNGVELMPNTLTKKIRSYPTEFSTKEKAAEAFLRLFSHFKNSILLLSYSSNAIPSKFHMAKLLREFKRQVEIYETRHKYSHGNHNHKVGDNNNSVHEYLFVAQ